MVEILVEQLFMNPNEILRQCTSRLMLLDIVILSRGEIR